MPFKGKKSRSGLRFAEKKHAAYTTNRKTICFSPGKSPLKKKLNSEIGKGLKCLKSYKDGNKIRTNKHSNTLDGINICFIAVTIL